MNSFFNLHSSEDYRNTNRPYYTSTWEYINVASSYLIPWQFKVSDSRYAMTITKIDTEGAETDITSYFYGATKITAWTKTGGGTWTSYYAQITGGTTATGNMTSNTFSLTAGQWFFMETPSTYYTTATDYTVTLKKAAATVTSYNVGVEGRKWILIAASGSDYTVVISYSGGGDSVTTHTPTFAVSTIQVSGNYRWYTGAQLSGTLSGVFRLKIETSAEEAYSDWCDACGFTDKTKISLSSSYDYGGIKYTAGYVQWMYKDCTVRRSPKAEIEIIGDKLNGSIIEEKKTTAIRYKITMKCTESEYEALVHAMAGTLTITDQTGRVFNAVNIELSDPTWYKANGIVDLSFIDSNNINIFTRNNTAL